MFFCARARHKNVNLTSVCGPRNQLHFLQVVLVPVVALCETSGLVGRSKEAQRARCRCAELLSFIKFFK